MSLNSVVYAIADRDVPAMGIQKGDAVIVHQDGDISIVRPTTEDMLLTLSATPAYFRFPHGTVQDVRRMLAVEARDSAPPEPITTRRRRKSAQFGQLQLVR